MTDNAEGFDAFVRSDGERIRRALVAAYGPTVGADATQSALSYGWENWSRVAPMDNPAGYLYRVGQSAAKRERRPVFFEPQPESGDGPAFEPKLIGALGRLSEQQRSALVLVHGYGYRLVDVAELLGVSVSTLRNHVRRGLEKLRNELGVNNVSA